MVKLPDCSDEYFWCCWVKPQSSLSLFIINYFFIVTVDSQQRGPKFRCQCTWLQVGWAVYTEVCMKKTTVLTSLELRVWVADFKLIKTVTKQKNNSQNGLQVQQFKTSPLAARMILGTQQWYKGTRCLPASPFFPASSTFLSTSGLSTLKQREKGSWQFRYHTQLCTQDANQIWTRRRQTPP